MSDFQEYGSLILQDLRRFIDHWPRVMTSLWFLAWALLSLLILLGPQGVVSSKRLVWPLLGAVAVAAALSGRAILDPLRGSVWKAIVLGQLIAFESLLLGVSAYWVLYAAGSSRSLEYLEFLFYLTYSSIHVVIPGGITAGASLFSLARLISGHRLKQLGELA